MAGLLHLKLLSDFFNKIGQEATFRTAKNSGRFRHRTTAKSVTDQSVGASYPSLSLRGRDTFGEGRSFKDVPIYVTRTSIAVDGLSRDRDCGYAATPSAF
jgi:hypothetical protein